MSIFNTPIKVNQLRLKNRLVMPPMATMKSEADGTVSQSLCEYYSEKTFGEYIGLVIAEHEYISPEGRAHKGQVSICSEQSISGLKMLVESVHKNHTAIMAQLSHAGGVAQPAVPEMGALSPSAIRLKKNSNQPIPLKEMDWQDIQKIIEDFTAAAIRAKEAGFDGVEIHSAHGYLLNQFYSPLTNKRTDQYNGNTINGRIKLHLEIIESIRQAVGSCYPIALRLGACDYALGGSTIQDSVLAAKEFEQAGIDLLDISGGFCGYINPGNQEQGYFSEITERIKEQISIPVLLTGGIVDVWAAEKLLLENKADLIGVGRAILKDSEWAKKAIQTLVE